MNIVSFGFRSVDDIPFSQPIITPSTKIKTNRKPLEGTYYSRNKEKVRQCYEKHKKELLLGCKRYYANNKKYFEEYRKRNHEKYKPHYRAYSFLKR